MSTHTFKALLGATLTALLTLVSLNAPLSAKPKSKELVKPAQAQPALKTDKLNTAASPAQQSAQGAGIDLNTATVEQLMTLKGIGKKRAEMIVQDREKNGPFSSLEDLTRVKGIGKKTVENNASKLTLSLPKAQPSAPELPKGR